ncbi:Uncharacterized protein Fot_03682 [Forsythia ovata]|uniref:Uncharacterized protein n=1 Tax=Forsythia ovata TaxID=205694 RepID=A0ABD1XAD6_9LAMI
MAAKLGNHKCSATTHTVSRQPQCMWLPRELGNHTVVAETSRQLGNHTVVAEHVKHLGNHNAVAEMLGNHRATQMNTQEKKDLRNKRRRELYARRKIEPKKKVTRLQGSSSLSTGKWLNNYIFAEAANIVAESAIACLITGVVTQPLSNSSTL